ncbi:MAG: hypothetical protein EB015_17485, partial [Methylocystaceae bacterium]|nr:hypothetical protein [Methylocystaceae bacterium]
DSVKDDIESYIHRGGSKADQLKVNVTLWLCDERKSGNKYPVVNHEIVQKLMNRRLPSFQEIRLRFIDYFIDARPGIIEDLPFESPRSKIVMANIGVLNEEELTGVIDMLHRMKLIDRKGGNSFCFLPDGFDEIENRLKSIESKEAFVAMWFNEQMNNIFDNAIKPAIEVCGYSAIRIDKSETINQIDDEIIAGIRRCKFLIADFTSEQIRSGKNLIHAARGGVYYEAGFAHGLGKPVIFMVTNSQIKDIHFDTRQYNHIIYNNAEEAKARLINRISATII